MQVLPVKFRNIVKYLQGKKKTFTYEFIEENEPYGPDCMHVQVGTLTRSNFDFLMDHCEHYDVTFNVSAPKGSSLLLFTFI